MITVYHGPIINPVSLTEYHSIDDALLAVNDLGIIVWIQYHVHPSMIPKILLDNNCSNPNIIYLHPGTFLMPGFVDTHTHASQVPNIGRSVPTLSSFVILYLL